MTPTVRDILIEARAKVHKALTGQCCVQDTQALFTLDQLIVGDARLAMDAMAREETVACLDDDESSRPTEKIVKPSRQDDDPDGRLIRGLVEENQRLKAELQRKREGR